MSLFGSQDRAWDAVGCGGSFQLMHWGIQSFSRPSRSLPMHGRSEIHIAAMEETVVLPVEPAAWKMISTMPKRQVLL